jgi:hypothetical protein
MAQDFTEPVPYVVMAEDGSEKEYAATVEILDPVLDQDNLCGTCCSVDRMYPDLYQQTVTAGVAGVLHRHPHLYSPRI